MDMDFLERLLMADTPSALLKANEEALFSFVPELRRCKGFAQNNPWHIYDVYEHILRVVDAVPQDRILRFAALFHDVGKPEVYHADEEGIGHFFGHWEESLRIFRAFSEKQRLEAAFTQCVSALIFYHDVNFDKLTEEEFDRVLKHLDVENIRRLFALKRADLLAQSPAYHHLLSRYDGQEKRAQERRQVLI